MKQIQLNLQMADLFGILYNDNGNIANSTRLRMTLWRSTRVQDLLVIRSRLRDWSLVSKPLWEK